MQLHKLNYGQTITLEIQTDSDEEWGIKIPAKHEIELISRDPVLLSYQDKTWAITGAGDEKHRNGKRNRSQLKKIIADGLPRICWVIQATKNTLNLKVHSFATQFRWTEAVELGVDDKIIEDYAAGIKVWILSINWLLGSIKNYYCLVGGRIKTNAGYLFLLILKKIKKVYKNFGSMVKAMLPILPNKMMVNYG